MHELNGNRGLCSRRYFQRGVPDGGGLIVPGSDITIRDVGVNPGRTGIIDILHRMGADIEVLDERMLSNEPVADIHVKYSPLERH